MRRLLPALLIWLAACDGATAPPGDTIDATAPDALAEDAALVTDGGKDAACAATFGNALTNAFGRVDGTVLAIVEPGNTRCALPNSDHVIVQVTMNGAAYRMVVNVESSGTDPNIRIQSLDAPLPQPAFAEGWHPALTLDYATGLGVHSSDAAWQSHPLAAASARISDAITVGQPISIYATSSGGTRADSAHLIHRNGSSHDGAIVVDPTGPTPHWLLFSFANQTF